MIRMIKRWFTKQQNPTKLETWAVTIMCKHPESKDPNAYYSRTFRIIQPTGQTASKVIMRVHDQLVEEGLIDRHKGINARAQLIS